MCSLNIFFLGFGNYHGGRTGQGVERSKSCFQGKEQRECAGQGTRWVTAVDAGKRLPHSRETQL